MHMVLTFTSLTVTGVQRVLIYKLRAISLCKTVEPKTETYTFSLPTQIWCIQNSIHPNFYNYLSSQSLRFYACGWFIIDWDFCISTIGRKVFIPDKVVTFVKLIPFPWLTIGSTWFNAHNCVLISLIFSISVKSEQESNWLRFQKVQINSFLSFCAIDIQEYAYYLGNISWLLTRDNVFHIWHWEHLTVSNY